MQVQPPDALWLSLEMRGFRACGLPSMSSDNEGHQRQRVPIARVCCEPAERNGANWTSGARCWRRTTGNIGFRDCIVDLWMSLRAKSATKCSTFEFPKVTLISGFKPKKVDRHSFKSYWVFGSAFSGFPRVLCLSSIGFISLRSVWTGGSVNEGRRVRQMSKLAENYNYRQYCLE